jgi:hypothetical protein
MAVSLYSKALKDPRYAGTHCAGGKVQIFRDEAFSELAEEAPIDGDGRYRPPKMPEAQETWKYRMLDRHGATMRAGYCCRRGGEFIEEYYYAGMENRGRCLFIWEDGTCGFEPREAALMALQGRRGQKITNPIPIDNSGFLAYPPYAESISYPMLRNCPEIMNLEEYILRQVPPVREPGNWSKVWDGSADTSWYSSDPEASSYTLTTAEQLAGINLVMDSGSFGYNNFNEPKKEITVKLGANILLNDLSDFENWHVSPPANNWDPIGSQRKQAVKFKFDAQGYTIRGCYCKGSNETGIFGSIGQWYYSKENPATGEWLSFCYHGKIHNLRVDNSYFEGSNVTGAILGQSRTGGHPPLENPEPIIKNCHFIGAGRACGDVRSSRNSYSENTGGICGYAYFYLPDYYSEYPNTSEHAAANFVDCTVTRAKIASAGACAGIAQHSEARMHNCHFQGKIEGGTAGYSGGIVGLCYGAVSKCYAAADIRAQWFYNGGIVGLCTADLTDCAFNGHFYAAREGAHNGMIAGIASQRILNVAAVRRCQAKGVYEVAVGNGKEGYSASAMYDVSYPKEASSCENFFKGTAINASFMLRDLAVDCYAAIESWESRKDDSIGVFSFNYKTSRCYALVDRLRARIFTPGNTYDFSRFSRAGGISCYTNNDADMEIDGGYIAGSPGAAVVPRKAMQRQETYEGWDFENIWTMEDNSVWL